MLVKKTEKKRHFWISSEDCNVGKSMFGRMLCDVYRAVKWNYTEKYQPAISESTEIVIFDAFRGQEEISILENLSDGDYHVASKMSDGFVLKNPIVFILANGVPREIYSKVDNQRLKPLYVRFEVVALTLIADNDAENQKKIGRTDGKKAIGTKLNF